MQNGSQERAQEDTSTEKKLFRRVNLHLKAEQRLSIYQSILDASHIDIEYSALLTLAGLIALFGLLENSAAVIIGAMLISPLMNPILSAALALLMGDGKLGKRSAAVLALSVAGVVGITWLIALMVPLKEATPQILARTQPNLLDLFIAFFSGLAGTLALRASNLAMTIVPGVAIAVAVVPPLAVTGYGLSTHQGNVAAGAFLLFVTNLVAIIISAVVVFRVMGFRPRWEAEQGRWKLKYRMGLSAAVLLVLSIPLFLTLRKAAIEVAIRTSVRTEMQQAFANSKATVSSLTFHRISKGLSIDATLQTTRYLNTRDIDVARQRLQKRFGPQTNLQIDQILVTHGGVEAAANPITGGVVKEATPNPPFNFRDANQQAVAYVAEKVDSVLTGTPYQRLSLPEIKLGTVPLLVSLELTAPQPVTEQTASLLSSQIGAKMRTKIELHGKVLLTAKPFVLGVSQTTPQEGMNLAQRKLLTAALKQAEAQVSTGSLQWNIACAPTLLELEKNREQAFMRDLRRVLKLSDLKDEQWTIVAGAMADASKKQTQGCDLQGYQIF